MKKVVAKKTVKKADAKKKAVKSMDVRNKKICAMYETGKFSYRGLAKVTGLSKSRIGDIVG